jgi:hypothetical protein
LIAAAFLAWLGAAVVVLSDGRRGLALGLALVTAGLAVLAWPAGMAFGTVAIAVGGLVAAATCWRSGPPAWGIMPAGSTPRTVLCIASGLLGLWVASSVSTGTGAPLRFGVLVVVGLMAARILISRETGVVLAGIACLALALAVAPGVGAQSPGPVPAIIGGLIAAGVMFVAGAPAPGRSRDASPAPADKDAA